MGLGSQVTNVDAISALTGLTHDIFVGRVVNNVVAESKTAQFFQNAGPGEYKFSGQNMTFAGDYNKITGGMATDGKLPDHVYMDAVQGTITPIRRYKRIAMDNYVELRASGEGAFDDLSDRIFDQLWDTWKWMEIRHSIGPATGLLGLCDSRTSSTVFVIKDAFGNTGTNPLSHIDVGSLLAWWDLTSTAAIDGAGKVSAITESTRTITMNSSATWEPGDTLAAGDYIYFCTTSNISTDYFISERNLAPNGLGTIIDPGAALSTVFGIAEATYPRSKPFRKASSTFDHLELKEHWLQLESKRGFEVTPATDACITYPSCVAQIARSLMGYQQQAYTGEDLKGGYRKIWVDGMPVTSDTFFFHNVCMTLNLDKLFRVNLGGDADFWEGDGSKWSRTADFDGREAFVVDYMNYFSPYRGAHGALTGISTDLTDSDFSNVPDY